MKTSQDHIDLIVRFLSGNISDADKIKLESWIEDKASNRKIFNDYKKTWDNFSRVSDTAGMDVQKEWEILNDRLDSQVDIKLISNSPIAIRRFTFWFVRIAAILVLALILSVTIFLFSPGIGHKSYSAEGTTLSALLPDGSRFTLNTGSTLISPKKFDDDQRTVVLTGEAYFEVQPDQSKPFIVRADELEIKVLGTSFNVNAYKDNDKVEVVVSTGEVAVTQEGEQTERLILRPGNRGTYNKSDQSLKLSVNEDPNFLSWKTRDFIFENKTLGEIVPAINKVYNSRIIIADNSLTEKRITVSFSNQSLDAILNVLSATLDINIRQNNKEIILSEKE